MLLEEARLQIAINTSELPASKPAATSVLSGTEVEEPAAVSAAKEGQEADASAAPAPVETAAASNTAPGRSPSPAISEKSTPGTVTPTRRNSLDRRPTPGSIDSSPSMGMTRTRRRSSVSAVEISASIEQQKAQAAALERERAEHAKSRALVATLKGEVEDAREEVSRYKRLVDGRDKSLKKCQGALAEAEERISLAEQSRDEALAAEDDLRAEIETLHAHKEDLHERYHQQHHERKRLHNKLVEIQGNIRVVCRVRPMLDVEEDTSGSDVDFIQYPDEDHLVVENVAKKQKNQFEFDRVFQPQSTQHDVFDSMSPLIQSCMDGYSVCIFAYGQTGSGKTYTMQGTPEQRGLNYRALEFLFSIRDHRRDVGDFRFYVTMVEIYNENIRDLLTEEGEEPKKLDVRRSAQGSSVPGLSEVEVSTTEEVVALMERGAQNRAVGSHNMNAESSRSHSCLDIRIEGQATDGSLSHAKLHLVDLAGSERVAKTDASGDQLVEAQHINRSLSALGDVISALTAKKGQHVPFRNSKLTFLLQDSLSGDSKVMMIVTISPALYNMSESLSSLNFASRCRTAELGQARKQGDTAEVTRLRKLVTKLQESKASDGAAEIQKYKALAQQLKKSEAAEAERGRQVVSRLEAEKATEMSKGDRLKQELAAMQEQVAKLSSDLARTRTAAMSRGKSDRKLESTGEGSVAEAKLKAELTRQRQSLQRVAKEKDEARRQHQVMERKAQGLASENTTSKRTIKRLQDEVRRLHDDLKRSRAAAATPRGATATSSPRAKKRTDSNESAGDSTSPSRAGVMNDAVNDSEGEGAKANSDDGSVASGTQEELRHGHDHELELQQERPTSAPVRSRSPRRSDGSSRPGTASMNSTRRKAGLSPAPQRAKPTPGVAFGSGRTPRPAPLRRGAGSERALGR